MADLRRIAGETLAPWVRGLSDCVLLDFQNHGNVGDSAIWLGEVAWLNRIGCRIRHVCSASDYDPRSLRRALGEGVIFLSGGGNLGDLWPSIQSFRERVVADFPDRRIVQLPQSIHFSSPQNEARARSIFAAHDDFQLVLRDRASLAIARTWPGISTHLCPDMVHMLDVPEFSREKEYRLLILSRADHEKAGTHGPTRAQSSDCFIADWIDQPIPPQVPRYRRARRWVRRRMPPTAYFERNALRFANTVATQRLRWGCSLLGSASAIITDRLHACLLGRSGGTRVYFVDNNYGKLSSYFDTWLADDPDLIACRGFDEAVERANEEVR